MESHRRAGYRVDCRLDSDWGDRGSSLLPQRCIISLFLGRVGNALLKDRCPRESTRNAIAVLINLHEHRVLHGYRLALGFALAALCLSTKSLMIPWRSSFLLASSRTSSVLTVVRPAWRLKFSRSMATASGRGRGAGQCLWQPGHSDQ